MPEIKSKCPFKCGFVNITNCSWCGRTYVDAIRLEMNELLPKQITPGMVFSLRKTLNARKFTCNGLVLKICRENGFKFIPEENKDKILIPCDHEAGELILAPDKVLYIRKMP